jgi:putative NADH-flavin reductase
MEPYKGKVALIGGTGKAGSYVLRELILKGYSVNVLVRNQQRLQFEHPLIEKIVVGDVSDLHIVRSLIHGCGAVVSTLGLGSPPSDPEIFNLATRNIMNAMGEFGISRYILITGLNVDTGKDKKGPATVGATQWMYANYPRSTKDRQLEYELLLKSTLDWTLVRLPLIDLTEIKSEVKISLLDCPGQNISSTSLAVFLVDQLQRTDNIRESPFIASA